MKAVTCRLVLLGLALACAAPSTVSAQTVRAADDGTTLKQIIIFGRHSIRAGTAKPEQLRNLAVTAYPDAFGVDAGELTLRGWQAEVLLGAYFREYLQHEGLLTADAQESLARSYFRANSIERSQQTAVAFQAGVMPGLAAPVVHSFPIGQTDPVFDPIGGGKVTVDAARAVAEVQAIFGDGTALPAAYSGEYALIRSVLFGYPLGTLPVPEKPNTPVGLVDVTALPITFTASTTEAFTGNVINTGGLALVDAACDPFIMQYADGWPLDQVGWGGLTPDTLSQETRILNLVFGIQIRSPYLNQLQSSNAASHVLRTMKQAVSGSNLRGAFGNAKSRLNVIISSDGYVAGLAGMLRMHWQLPGYQPDFCSPGGALVFELRQATRPKRDIVRVYYTSQTLDQLRNLTPLTLDNPPATLQLLVPGGSSSPTDLDVKFSTFKKLLEGAIEPKYVEKTSKEIQPAVLPLEVPAGR